MGRYIDGFVIPVKKDRIEEYRKIAQDMAKIWIEHGALESVECVAEDVKPGKLTSFPQSVQLGDDETVVMSWIVYESRQHRDQVNALVMKDERLNCLESTTMPFDMKRMFFGGFEVLVHAKSGD